MKKYLFAIWVSFFSIAQICNAQDDDIYFVPSGDSKEMKQSKQRTAEPEYVSEDEYAYSNWAENRSFHGRDVDEYNRRGGEKQQDANNDTYNEESPSVQEVSCTERIVRFHSPTVGVIVSSPYYSDYVDIWLDPWYYDPWYGGFGFYGYYGWNSWRYHYYWNNPWYWHDPWYNPWGPCYGWYDPWYRPHYRPVPAGAHYGPHGGYVYYGNRDHSGNRHFSNNRYGSRYDQNNRPSRDFGNRYNNGRPSRNFGNSSDRRPSRDFGNSNTSRPSRRFGNNSNDTPSRDFSGSNRHTERNFGNTPSRSFNSGNSGGGRHFGTGNSRGGRR